MRRPGTIGGLCWLGAVALAAGACHEPEAGVHLVIDGDLTAPAELDRLTVTVHRPGADSALASETFGGSDLRPFPLRLNLLSGKQTPSGAELVVQARGLLGNRLVASASATVQLTPGTGATATLWLSRLAVPDGGDEDAGTDPPDAGTDAGTPDAGTPDAGTPDAGTPDAGTCRMEIECPVGHYCKLGRCLRRQAVGARCADPRECQNNLCVDGFCCDGFCANSCQSCALAPSPGLCGVADAGALGRPSCGAYRCNGSAITCPTACGNTAACAPGHYCSGGTCVPHKPRGAACTAAEECRDGRCVDGYCCDELCTGACERCNIAGSLGTCRDAPAGHPGSPSCSPYVCSGDDDRCPNNCVTSTDCAAGHSCQGYLCVPLRVNGASCDAGAACQSARCVDGVCCNSACSAPCESCSRIPGTCTSAAPYSPGRPSCSPYLCDGTGTACPTGCDGSSGCAAGFRCLGADGGGVVDGGPGRCAR